MIKVLIADDHSILREGIKSMLDGAQDLSCVGEAANGEEVLARLASVEVDIVLMDISMPVMDGMEATRLISAQHPEVRVIALTMLEQGSFVRQMLKCGAKGYLLKNAGKDTVLAAIRAVHSGQRFLDPVATELLFDTIARQEQYAKSYIPELTRREKEVLAHIANGLSDSEIAKELFISASTVESHRKNLRTKIGARNSAEMVRIAMERGLL